MRPNSYGMVSSVVRSFPGVPSHWHPKLSMGMSWNVMVWQVDPEIAARAKCFSTVFAVVGFCLHSAICCCPENL